jgi:hypothetical protein
MFDNGLSKYDLLVFFPSVTCSYQVQFKNAFVDVVHDGDEAVDGAVPLMCI